MSISSVEIIKMLKQRANSAERITIESIYNNVEQCKKCDLKTKLECNSSIVKYSGRLNAPIMIIGKNPSYKRRGNTCFGNEDYVNNPHLEKLLNNYEFTCDDVYSTNLVKCSTEDNIDPSDEQLNCCKDFLINEISIIKPKIIICVGKFSSNFFQLKFGEHKKIDDIIYVSIKHPSSLSYNNDEESKKLFYSQLDCISDEIKKIRNKSFVQLHFHDEYSIRDAIGRIEDYTKLIYENNLPAFSVTNHGAVGGFIRQYFMCKKIGIKPIFGCELYINNNRFHEDKKSHRKNFHLCVYAKNLDGFNNICKITSDAWINGFYYHPRTDIEFIRNNSKGLYASSACSGSELSYYVSNNMIKEAKQLIKEYKEIFEDFFIELMIIDMPEQVRLNNLLAKIAIETDTKTIITCDTHYMKKEYSKVHDIMLLIRDNHTLEDLNDASKKDKIHQYKAKDLYYKNTDEIYKDFKTIHEGKYFTEDVFWNSIDNVFGFVNNIDKIVLDTSLKLPKLNENNEQILWEHILNGFKERNINIRSNINYFERAKYEYEIICKKNFTDYFLIMEDIIKYAKTISLVGAGRGSSSGSLIAYLLRITEIDPIKYGLLFERFIAIERYDIPDIDSDFEPRFRDDIKKYIIKRFGEENVCTIGTYGTYKSRGTLLDIARVYGIPFSETLHLTKNVMTSDCDTMSLDEIINEFEPVKNYIEKYPFIKDSFDIINKQIKTISKHAAGVVISDRNLRENIALMQSDGHIFSAWQEGSDFHELSSLGYIKFDILGLNNLSVISDCIKLIKERHGVTLDFYNWPDMEDEKALKLASEADTFGVFQFESRISRDLLKKIGVNCFMDLSHISSLLRPGPLRAGVPEIFAKRKNGEIRYKVPEVLEDILGDTFGIMIYQEQIMLIAQKIGGFNQAESNEFRKALVKYGKGESVEAERISKAMSFKEKFVNNSKKYISEDEVNDLWEKMLSFVNYGFNKSHAVAYAYISYIQFYLKAHYFIEFITALLNNTERGKETNQRDSYLKMYINYARENGIEVLNPDINLSEKSFNIIGNNKIVFGFNHIKNMGDKYDIIIKNRPYKSFDDFFKKINKKTENTENFFNKKSMMAEKNDQKINKSKIESLIYSGSFDKFGDRNELIKKYNIDINKNKKYDHKDLSEQQIIEKEIEMLSLCLSRSIFDDEFVKLLKKNNCNTPSYINDNELEVCNIGGILKKIKEKQFKSGKRIGEKYKQIEIQDDFNIILINLFNQSDIDYISSMNIAGKRVIIKNIKRFFNGTYVCQNKLENCLKIIM